MDDSQEQLEPVDAVLDWKVLAFVRQGEQSVDVVKRVCAVARSKHGQYSEEVVLLGIPCLAIVMSELSSDSPLQVFSHHSVGFGRSV